MARDKPASEARVVVPDPDEQPTDELEEDLAGAEAPDPDEIDPDLGEIFALSDPSLKDVTWYVYRMRHASDTPPGQRVSNAPLYIAKLVGPLDIEELRKSLGGGHFKVLGFRGRKKIRERQVEFEGPYKVFDAKPSEPSPAPQARVVRNTTSPELLAFLSRLDQRMDKLEEKTGSAPNGAITMKDILALLQHQQQQQSQPTQSPDAAILKEMFGMAREFAESSRNSDGDNTLAVVLDKVGPIVEKVFSQPRRPPQRPGPAAPPPSPTPTNAGAAVASSAEIVDDPGNMRMGAVIDALARAVAEGLDPAEFADTVEVILPSEEVAMLRAMPVEEVMKILAEVTHRFPILATPEARAYVESLLAYLNTTPDASEPLNTPQ